MGMFFILRKVTPLLNEGARNIRRFCISDEYLNFFNQFIQPELKNIESDLYLDSPLQLISNQRLQICLGFMLEKWCRKNHKFLAEIMEFNQVRYDYGAYFSKKSDNVNRGFQIDLMYIRKDARIVLCEIKNYSEIFDDNKIISKAESNMRLFLQLHPQYKNYTFELAIIAPEGVSDNIRNSGTFRHIITFNDIFNAA